MNGYGNHGFYMCGIMICTNAALGNTTQFHLMIAADNMRDKTVLRKLSALHAQNFCLEI